MAATKIQHGAQQLRKASTAAVSTTRKRYATTSGKFQHPSNLALLSAQRYDEQRQSQPYHLVHNGSNLQPLMQSSVITKYNYVGVPSAYKVDDRA
jgi:hypothetical protein